MGTIVTANPGIFKLIAYDPEDGTGKIHIEKLPVVAWDIRLIDDVQEGVPVVFGFDFGDWLCAAIEFPDGHIQSVEGNHMFKDFDAFRHHAQARLDNQVQARAEHQTRKAAVLARKATSLEQVGQEALQAVV